MVEGGEAEAASERVRGGHVGQEGEEKLVNKKFARLEAKGDKSGTEKREEIEKKRREVKENLAKVMKEGGRKVAELKEKVEDPTGGEDQVVENGPKV